MNLYRIAFRSLFIGGLLSALPSTANVVQTDTIVNTTVTYAPLPQPTSGQSKGTAFNPKSLIAPGVLIGVGAWGINHRWAVRQKQALADDIQSWNKGKSCGIDNYLRFLPLASYLGLRYVGAKGEHNLLDRTLIAATSTLAMGIITKTCKMTIHSPRPDGTDNQSFPSGHTAIAFMGAELVRKEYGAAYGAGAYVVASGIGFLRLYNNKHWVNDVIAGAGVGILCANIGYWMLPLEHKLINRCWPKKRQQQVLFTALPAYDPMNRSFGTAVSLTF